MQNRHRDLLERDGASPKPTYKGILNLRRLMPQMTPLILFLEETVTIWFTMVDSTTQRSNLLCILRRKPEGITRRKSIGWSGQRRAHSTGSDTIKTQNWYQTNMAM